MLVRLGLLRYFFSVLNLKLSYELAGPVCIIYSTNEVPTFNLVGDSKTGHWTPLSKILNTKLPRGLGKVRFG